MAQRRPKAAILGSRIGRPQTRSLVDEPARRLPPDKCPDLPAQGSTGTRAAIFVSPPMRTAESAAHGGARSAGLPLVHISGEPYTRRRAHRASGCLLYLYRQWSSLISEQQSP